MRLRWREEWLATLAEAQDGVVERHQLLALGATEDAIGRRIEQRRLIPVHAGVYAVGRRQLTHRGRWRAALLSCGTGARLSHATSAALRDLHPAGGPIHVLVPRVRCPRHEGVVVHRTFELAPQDLDHLDGFPCTSVPRTFVDLAGVVRPPALARAVEAADRLELLDVEAIDDVLSRIARPRGVRALRAILAEHRPVPHTRRELERRFFRLCDGLPTPAVNALIEGLEVDFHWPAARLIVETDGWDTHRTRAAARRDRARDRHLAREGWLVLRFMWHDVLETPDLVRRDIEDALHRRMDGEMRLRRPGG